VIYGILRYTQWPRLSDPLRLCISRDAPDAGEIRRQMPGTVHGRELAVVFIGEDVRPIERCDAVYLDGWPVETVRDKLRALAGQPVLTLGRGADFCTDGGMFCLQAHPGATRFEVNLNAISLSGLRVHPRVLRLARPAGMGAS
jgi:YfiR/HmsC-like